MIKIEDLEEMFVGQTFLDGSITEEVPMPEAHSSKDFNSEDFIKWLSYRAYQGVSEETRKKCKANIYAFSSNIPTVMVDIQGYTFSESNFFRNYPTLAFKVAANITQALKDAGDFRKSLISTFYEDMQHELHVKFMSVQC